MVVSSLSEAQVEAFLADAVPTYGDLAAVAEVLSAVRAIAWTDSDVDFSGLFIAAARESRVTPIERFADEQSPKWRWRWVSLSRSEDWKSLGPATATTVWTRIWHPL